MTQNPISTIIIVNPNSEISREGFKTGDKIKAEIMPSGSAWFRGESNWCVLYKDDYYLI